MRCYNGCPDKELQALIDDCALAAKQLDAVGARATYFPVEERWMVFRDYLQISEFHHTIRQAADAVLGPA